MAPPADDDIINRSPFMALVGPILREEHSDILAVDATEKHNNAGGVTHGGMLMTMLDNTMGRLARIAAKDAPVVTAQLNTHFIASGRPGERLSCEAKVVRAGASIIFMQGALHAGDRLIATADGIWKVLKPRP